MESIRGVFVKKLFFDQESAQMTFLFRPYDGWSGDEADGNGCLRVYGRFCLDVPYLPIEITGHFRKDAHGDELIPDEISLTCTDLVASERFLTSSEPSLQKRAVRKILDATGPDVFDAAFDPSLEEEARRRTGKDAALVHGVFARLRSMSEELDLFKVLTEHGGNYEQTLRILDAYPDGAMAALRDEPYGIPEKAGVPFSVIDSVALGNGADLLCEPRIDAILTWTLGRIRSAGNSYATFDEVASVATKRFGDIPKTLLLADLKTHPKIVMDRGAYYEKSALADESNAARSFARLMRSRKNLPYHPEYIPRIEEEQGYEFGSQQKEAFLLLKTTGFKLLTGDPGTGKTSTLKGLLRYLEILWEDEFGRKPEFALCAPSGRAAQRMKEATGRPAQTVHKLIEYQPFGDGEYYRDASNPLTADVVVVDESSMMGLSIFTKLISAVKNGAMILMIGDVNQLQSVDAGDVLQDVIRCGYVEICNLTETFRQNAGSKINGNAKKIMCGDPRLEEGDDFEVIECEPDQTKSALLGKISELMLEFPKNSIQVLCPMRDGSCGVREGNKELQKLMNPGSGGMSYGRKTYRIGDRVIMNTNNYAVGYYNGDVGFITRIGEGSVEIRIGDESVVLPKEKYGDMDLAYSVTIHKSQGSEYGCAVIVLQEKAAHMLDRNLLYTAVTRGKKKVVILSEPGMIEKAIGTYRTDSRNSFLSERISDEIEAGKKKKNEKEEMAS